ARPTGSPLRACRSCGHFAVARSFRLPRLSRSDRMSVIEVLRERSSRYARIRRDIHAHPELAYAEHRTSDLVARHLESLGIETHRGLGGTGVVGVLRAGTGKRAIGLRADMDALPMQEH